MNLYWSLFLINRSSTLALTTKSPFGTLSLMQRAIMILQDTACGVLIHFTLRFWSLMPSKSIFSFFFGSINYLIFLWAWRSWPSAMNILCLKLLFILEYSLVKALSLSLALKSFLISFLSTAIPYLPDCTIKLASAYLSFLSNEIFSSSTLWIYYSRFLSSWISKSS